MKHKEQVAFLLIATIICLIQTKLYADSMEQRILNDINQYRIHHRIQPLKLNPVISEQARKHSSQMCQRILPFGHQHFDKRIKQIYAKIPGAKAGAENIAYNYKVGNIVNEWLKSPGHKRNIDGRAYNLTGIGVAQDKQGKLCYTQIFIHSF